MTVEEKAEEYAKSYPNQTCADGFIAGYNMRDGESQAAIEALQSLVAHYNEHGQILTWNVGIAIQALKDLPQPPKNV